MEYIEPQPTRRMSALNAAIDATEAAQKATKECATCKGTGRAVSAEPIPVMQHGRRVGYLPPSFDPTAIRSTSFLYDPRPGDFRREADVWVASRTLGPGDLESVPGFVWVVHVSDRLVDRLRGKYASGPHLPNGNPEFGWRQFQAPPIQHAAADRIEELEAKIAAVEGVVLSALAPYGEELSRAQRQMLADVIAREVRNFEQR